MITGSALHDRLFHGDSIQVMQRIPDASVDLILTDPPYLVNYQGRDGRCFRNDDPNTACWLAAASAEMYRVLRPDSLCLSFHGWPCADLFLSAWREAGLRPVSHITTRFSAT